MKKSLHLRREALSELDDGQLEFVAGGVSTPTCMPTCQSCFSLDQCNLPSVPLRDCPRA